MKLSKIINDNPNLKLNTFETIKIYVLNRYGNFDCKYEESLTINLLDAITFKYSNLLNNIESAIQIREEQPISYKNLGTILTTDNLTDMTVDNQKKDSYSGYEVIGDYQIRDSDTSQQTKSKRNEQNMSYTYNLTQLEQLRVKYNMDEFEQEILNLLITTYVWDYN